MVGQTIRKFRKEKGLTQTELAIRAGVDKSYLRSIERKDNEYPSFTFVEKIAQALNISVDSILVESSLDTIDPDWDKIILEALQAGVTPEEYIAFLESPSSSNNKRITVGS
ncbi:hypothetical protein BTR23_02850 [Alkalihalophilus pseudofirmus]|nr:hypothetical protein BTR23_02850 [Alkalihalophilus pseudofirmus]